MSTSPSDEAIPEVATLEVQSVAERADAGSSSGGPGAHGKRARKRRSPWARNRRPNVAFLSEAGRLWRFTGSRAHVLKLLVRNKNLTWRDTLIQPSTFATAIYELRQSGLIINSFRSRGSSHASYRLMTPGSLTRRRRTRG
jgi:hypothetical protein